MAVREVIFDLGNVLVPFDWRIAVRRLIKYLPAGLARKARNDPKALALAITDLIDALEIGSINFNEFYRLVVLRIGLTVDLAKFKLIWCEIFELNYQMARLGLQLSERYGVWLASNTDEEHYNYITQKFPEVLFYKKAALSYQMGTKKPDLQYFVKALELFQIEPEHAIFIDDLMVNVQAARKLGIVGLQFTTYQALLEELARYGVIAPPVSRSYSIGKRQI